MAEHEARLAWERAELEACQQQKEKEFAWEMAELELQEEEEWKMKEEVEQKAQEEHEQKIKEEEEGQRLRLASKQEKRWLVELATQKQKEQMVEGSLKSGSNWNVRVAGFRKKYVHSLGEHSHHCYPSPS